MLSAILNGKGRRLPPTVRAGSSLRAAFAKSEDILTATVFERLAYLEGPVLWALLASTFRPRVLPDRKVAELSSIEFWPTWWAPDGGEGRSVEPDVVMRLSVGDPAADVTLVVECKLGGLQYPAQWAREWIAARQEGVGDAAETYLLALGGIPAGAEAAVRSFTDGLRESHGIEVRAAAADWRDLLAALGRLEPDRASDRRVVADVRAALALHGYADHEPMASLAGMAAGLRIPDGAADAMRWPDDRPRTATAGAAHPAPEPGPLDGWTARAAPFLGLRDHPTLRWSDEP